MKTRWIPLIFLGLSVPLAAAVVPFVAADTAIDNDLVYLRDLAVGEMSGDELLDLVFCGENSGAVRYRKSLGGGAYSPLTITDALDSPYTLALGDLDHDGDLDIVVGQYDNISNAAPHPPEEAEVLWMRNPLVGGGAWTLFPVDFLSTSGARNVAVGDVDGDGRLDILLAYVDDSVPGDPLGLITWFRNTGEPEVAWDAYVIGESLDAPWDVAVADLDEDGDLDVAAVDFDADRVLVYSNDGTPLNGGWTLEELDAGLGGARSVAIGDLDGDGWSDVVAAGYTDADLVWYEGPSAWTGHVLTSDFLGAGDVSVVDIDQDGDSDIVARAYNDNEIAWWDNWSGDGSYWLKRDVSDEVSGPTTVDAADLDHDGDLDLVACSLVTDEVVWWRNKTIHRRFHAAEPLVVRSALASPRELTLADLNGDGWLDWVAALWDGDAIPAYLAVIPDSNIWMDDTLAAADSFDGARAVATADINGDGQLDVLGAAANADDIVWWENDGDWDPDWTRHNVFTAFDGAHRALPADFEGDGDVDLAVIGYNADELRLILNEDGLGTDWSYTTLLNVNGPFDLKIGDIDRNGYPDMVVSGYDSDSLRVVLDNYPDPWVILTVASGAEVDGPRGIDLCDVDDDGDLDLVALLRLVDRVRWYENEDGDGLTWTPHDVGSGAFVDGAGVRCVDLDADADVDVVAAGQDGDAVYYWLNGGTGGTWTRVFMEQSLDSPWAVDAGDLDRDGDVDLAVAAGGTADRLLWYRNVGGQFACTGHDDAPSSLAEGESAAILNFIVQHNGRVGDSSLEVRHLFVDFTDTAGTPLTSAQANALIDRLEVFQDTDQNLVFEPGADTLVHTVTTLVLTDGREALVLPDAAPAARVGANGARMFFVVATAAAGAGGQTPNRIVAALPTAEVVAEDYTNDLALLGEPAETVTTDPILFGGDLIFADDFESGGTTHWSSTTGG